jgi:hypothetical protein
MLMTLMIVSVRDNGKSMEFAHHSTNMITFATPYIYGIFTMSQIWCDSWFRFVEKPKGSSFLEHDLSL